MNNSSNSFNICPRCGNSNALSAKYCSRCGGQLKVPETPTVCPKCHTHNSAMSKYCRNCGTLLKAVSGAMHCPECGREITPDKKVCECGHHLVASQPANDKANKKQKDTKVAKAPQGEVVYSNKSGRGWAIAGIVFVLLFAYLIIAPQLMRPKFLYNFDKGIVSAEGAGLYGYNFISLAIGLLITHPTELLGEFGIGGSMLLVLVVIFAVTAVAHLIVCIVRSITKKRSKKGNIFFLVMAIISTLLVGLVILFNMVEMKPEWLQKVAKGFTLSEDYTVGYTGCAIAIYYWFFYLYSLCAKAKKLKESTK